MSKAGKNEFSRSDEFYDMVFSNLDYSEIEIKNKTFEACQFLNSSFISVKFISCKFIDCEFKSCNLSSVELNNSSFSEVVFEESKLIGINWTRVGWPCVKLVSPVKFYKSNISHSSFFELDLKEVVIEECKAHDVDFRGGDFSNASFVSTDFEDSIFMQTKLCETDFTDAINYGIDPNQNDIKKAKFTMPDAINLLNSFDIEIDGVR